MIRTKRPWVVGIVGGVASGKSTVGKHLQEQGAIWLRADDAGHDVLRQPEVVTELVARFGNQIIDETDSIDRKELAKRVFGVDEKSIANRRFLESVTHPRIRERLRKQLNEIRSSSHPPEIVLLDVPLLFESGWDKECDEVIFVDTPESRRRQFATARGWSEKDWLAREKSQLSVEEKRNRATTVFENDSSLEALFRQIDDWLRNTNH